MLDWYFFSIFVTCFTLRRNFVLSFWTIESRFSNLTGRTNKRKTNMTVNKYQDFYFAFVLLNSIISLFKRFLYCSRGYFICLIGIHFDVNQCWKHPIFKTGLQNGFTICTYITGAKSLGFKITFKCFHFLNLIIFYYIILI